MTLRKEEMPRIEEKSVRQANHRLKVRDPKGKMHEVPHLNAVDLINHLGWKLVTDETEKAVRARAPRVKNVEGRKEEHEKMNTIVRTDRKKRPGAKSRKLASGPLTESVVVEDVDDAERVDTVDDPGSVTRLTEDELDAKEAAEREERKRVRLGALPVSSEDDE